MIKKYIKKSNLINFYKNFSTQIIDIDWKKINYNRISLINKAVNQFKDCKYLEIGCQTNICFDSISANYKVGVDPQSGGTIRDTSDNFFNSNDIIFDVIFIDGLHTFDQCRKDIINSFKFLKIGGYIFLHDLIPRTWMEENTPPIQGVWTGDIWKVLFELNKTDGINFWVILADHGIGIVKKINNNILYHDQYENLKKLNFNNFINKIDEINFIEAKEAIKIIETK